MLTIHRKFGRPIRTIDRHVNTICAHTLANAPTVSQQSVLTRQLDEPFLPTHPPHPTPPHSSLPPGCGALFPPGPTGGRGGCSQCQKSPGGRRLHTNTACAHLWVSAGIPAEHRQCLSWSGPTPPGSSTLWSPTMTHTRSAKRIGPKLYWPKLAKSGCPKTVWPKSVSAGLGDASQPYN